MLRFAMILDFNTFFLIIHFLFFVCFVGNGTEAHNAPRNAGQPLNNRREENIVRIEKSKEVFKYMNLSSDPCKDFYEYACGNWEKYNGRKIEEEEKFNAQNMLQNLINQEIQVLLEEPSRKQDVPKEFYNSCRHVESPSQVQKNFMMDFIKQYGGLAMLPNSGWQINYDWVQTIAQLRANYDMDILIGLEIDSKPQTMRGNSIYLGEPKSTLIPIEYCSSNAAEMADIRNKFYEDIQRKIAINMQTWVDMRESDANRFAGDIVRFEFELCKHMRQNHLMKNIENERDSAFERGIESTDVTRYRTGQSRLHGQHDHLVPYPRMDLYQLTQRFNNIINFKMFVDISFNTAINNQVYVRSVEYFQHLARSVKSNNKHTFANYIMYHALNTLNFPSTDHSSVKRRKTCVELTKRYFPKQVGNMYWHKAHNDESHNDLQYIFNEIIKGFEQHLQVPWMDENDKRAARQKLTQYKLSFPDYQNLETKAFHFEQMDYWHKLDMVLKYNARQKLNRLQMGDYGQHGERVEAYDAQLKLIPMDNELATGLGLIQTPFYSYYYPKSVKYALLGQRIASELIFAFDDQGWNANLKSPMRWRTDTLIEYSNRSECYRSQYSNYLCNNPEMFRNTSKLREIIADSSGLNIAFTAYITWLESVDSKTNSLSKETLPGLNFTNTQLFFIYFAQTRCMVKFGEEPKNLFPLDKHQPERFDVNGPVSNNDDFGIEFGCALGSQMNPDDKCKVF